MDIFTKKIIKAIDNLHGVDEIKKGVAVHIIKYLIPLNLKCITFRIKDLIDFTSLDYNLLNQPYDTFRNPTGFEEAIIIIMDIDCDSFDKNKYLSLLESTLMMLMSYNLRWAKSEGDSFGLRTRIYGYPVFCKISMHTTKNDFFASSFEVEFSDEFWFGYQTSRTNIG